jgi:hypothetical protein
MNAALIAVFGVLEVAAAQAQPVPGHHDHAAPRGASVMSFDLGRSTHVFTPTRNGAIPQMGQLPGPTWRICGCIGQV